MITYQALEGTFLTNIQYPGYGYYCECAEIP